MSDASALTKAAHQIALEMAREEMKDATASSTGRWEGLQWAHRTILTALATHLKEQT